VGTGAGPLTPDLVGEFADFGDLVGGEQQRGVMVGVADLLAKGMHALQAAADGVIGGRLYELRDGCAEACSQRGFRLSSAALTSVSCSTLCSRPAATRDIRAARIAQQPCDFRQMLVEWRPIALAPLTGVTARSVRERREWSTRDLIGRCVSGLP